MIFLSVDNQRKEKRLPFTACLQYTVYGDPTGKLHNCVAVDRSKNGMGIMSSTPLDFGQFIILNMQQEQNVSPAQAMVQWSAPVGVNFRVGLTFI